MLSLRTIGPYAWCYWSVLLVVLWVPRPGAAAVSCVGDCGGHGAVTLGDLVTMVNIALDPAKLTDCEAGDANGDKSIEVDELITAASNDLRGCVALHLNSPTGAPGTEVQLVVTLHTASLQVFGTDNCIALPPGLSLATTNSGGPDCKVNAEIQKNGTAFIFNSPFCPNTFEAFVATGFAEAVKPIPDGAQLYTCNVKIAADALPGPQALTCTNAEASAAYLSSKSQLVTTSCTDGIVSVVAP